MIWDQLRRTLAGAFLIGGAFAVTPAYAVDFNFGGNASLSIDSTATLGMTFRTSKQSCRYISQANGGCPDGIGQYANINLDDGNVNFAQGDIASAIAKIVSDVEFRKDNWGAFLRLKAYYDYITVNKAGRRTTRYGERPLTQDGQDAGRDIEVLDAFAFVNFDIGNVPTTLRAGKQVINWGESLFIQGGINQFDAIDVAAIRTPGAELKEALLPEESVYANFSLPYSLSLEAFYAFHWRRTTLDPVGTFFSAGDLFGPGAQIVSISTTQDGPGTPDVITKALSDYADNQGQWGVKLGYWADWLNRGTELSAYFVNYHSKLPFLEYSNGAPQSQGGGILLPLQQYREQYPENIKYVGASFATTVSGIAIAGESLYSWNMPLQLSSGEILAARLAENLGAVPNAAVLPYDPTPGAFPKGYTREKVVTGQISAIAVENPSSPITSFLRGDLTTLIANWGYQWLPGIDGSTLSVLNAGRGSEITHPNAFVTAAFFNPAQPLIHADKFSSGYRLAVIEDYNNAFNTAWKLSPTIQWAQDFGGTSAGNIGPGFLKNKKTITVGVTANLQNVWKVDVKYTSSFGNKLQNYTQDRDFLSMSVSYAF